MKLTFSWLKDHLETTADVATIADTLTMLGLEVESIEDRAKRRCRPSPSPIVKEAKKHPNADKLQRLPGRYRHGNRAGRRAARPMRAPA